jgi:hypothetical protein
MERLKRKYGRLERLEKGSGRMENLQGEIERMERFEGREMDVWKIGGEVGRMDTLEWGDE